MRQYEPITQGDDTSSEQLEEESIAFLEESKTQPPVRHPDTTKSSTPRRRPSQLCIGIYLVICILAICGPLFFVRTRETIASAHDTKTETIEKPRKALVLASYTSQDTSWLKDIPDDWEIHKYTLDDATPHNQTLTVPRNQGREAMAYLTYILQNYNDLPTHTIFTHGHAHSWHQPEPLAWKIRALDFSLLDTEGYINLRCGLKPGCDDGTILGSNHPEPRDHPKVRQMMPAWWELMYRPPHGRWDFGPYPPELGQPCCAQFAVTRARILSRPREFYEAYRRPMERDVTEYKALLGNLWNGYRMGILYEHTWHVVFGKGALLCPAPEYCRRVVFRDLVRCSGYTGDFDHSAGWRGVKCVNGWDGDVEWVEEGKVDRWGGWDGFREVGKGMGDGAHDGSRRGLLTATTESQVVSHTLSSY